MSDHSNLEETSATAAIQNEIKGITNFRDVGESVGEKSDGIRYMQEGMIFRSATLEDIEEEDIRLLIERFKFKIIVDLSDTDHSNIREVPKEQDSQEPRGLQRRNSRRFLNQSKSEPEKPLPSSVLDASTAAQIHSEVVHGLPTYKFDFAGKKYMWHCVWCPCPMLVKLKVVMLILTFQKPKATQLIGQTVIAPKGLAGMYIDFVEASREEIVSTLKLFGDIDNYPVLVHCTQGKDRTGLIIALILSIVDVPEDVIARDYALSQSGLEKVYQETVDSMARKGLGSEFADAPEEAIRETLHHITSKHGSVPAYLTAIGFDEKWQQRVRQILTQQEGSLRQAMETK